MEVGTRQSDKDLELEERWAVGRMEEGFPLAFAHHFGRSSDSRGQMSTHTQRHTRGILSSTGSTIGPDLTQNNVPDDNMQIID